MAERLLIAPKDDPSEVVEVSRVAGLTRVIRAVLEQLVDAGSDGYPIAGLRLAYNALGLSTEDADRIERKLVEDVGIVVSGGRMYFPHDHAAVVARWKRLSETRQ